jgi:hypothetical protein
MAVNVDFSPEDFKKFSEDARKTIADAATGTVTEVANRMVRAGRQNIASAGFGSKWQNALRASIYPRSGTSINAAAVVRHKIPYAEVFELGATIRGKPLLWVPINGNKQRISQFRGAHLFSINRPGKPPLLAIKRGKETIPMFVGIDQVTLRKRLDLYNTFEQQAQSLPDVFQSKLKG